MPRTFFEDGKVMKKTVFLTILFCFCAHSNTYTQHPSPRTTSDSPTFGRPLIRNYDPTEYGAAFNYWAIAQDQRGVMYFGNWNGILEYDGVSWRLISTPNKSGVRSLAIEANGPRGPFSGRIYVGAVGDLGYLAPDAVGNMRFVSLLDHVPPGNREFNEVWYSYATSEGVYFRTDRILLRWANQRMQTWKPATSFSGLFVVRDRVYIQQWGVGLLELAGDSLRLAAGGARFANERIYVMLPYAEQKILTGTREQGLFLYDGASFQAFQTDPTMTKFLRENQLSHGAVLPDDTFALATLRGGVAIMDRHGQLLRILDKAAGLQDHDVNFIFPDRQGAIWLAQGRRIARVETASPLSFYGEPAGIKDFVAAILRHRGTLYVATGLGVFYLPSQPGKTNSPLPERAPEFRPVAGITAQCWSLVTAGKTLLAATNDGVYQITGERAAFVKQSAGDSFFSMFLRRSKQDSNRVYIGLRDGLASLRFDAATSQWIDEGRIRGIHEPIWSIVENADGELWLGTEAQGVLRVHFPNGIPNQTLRTQPRWNENPKVERFDFRHGLPHGWVGVNAVRDRTIFTSDKGLFRFDRETNRFFPDSTYGSMFADGLRDVEVVVEDRQGNVWLGSEEAAEIHRALRQPDGSYLPEKGAPFQLAKVAIWAIYPEDDSADNGTASAVWFGGPDGLVRYDANIPRHEMVDYPALVRRVTIAREAGGDSIIFAGTATVEGSHATDGPSESLRSPLYALRPTLSYSHNALRFECAAPSFDEESANQFQYFLEGFDQGWTAWSKSPKKDYTNLFEGEYRFHVRAKNVYQHESREAVYAFKILPPWYRTWWVYVLYALIAVAIVLGIRRYDLHRQKQKAENQRRVQELEEARQLQLSMLPQTIPQLPDLELAVYMKPATEVGGDYYDFHLSEDGALTVALGDATGHGLKAGTMVTAMKSLFMTLGHKPALTEIFQHSNQAIKRMNLRQIYMTLLLVRINGRRLSICGAGMPPVLIHHAATQQVEEIDLKGMPLGCVPEFPYEQRELALAPGDVIILMSDGFAERFNAHGEILGYEQAKQILAAAAPQSADEVIERFVQASEAWADGSLQNDDTTFVVVKVRNET
jgi:serine phosphatase RsbU (regulator of sigma subunit)